MATVGSGLLCVSGSALGAALAMLVSTRQGKQDALTTSLTKGMADLERKTSELMSGMMEGAHRQGFTMAEAKAQNDEMKLKFNELTPIQVLEDLQRGNARFWTGQSTRPEVDAFQRRALIMQQFPTTAVLGCSDSRVPTELIFDQPLGELFVVRVAGNYLGVAPKASLQYAITHLKVKVVLVLGHEGCGAVKAADSSMENIDEFSEDLAIALKSMKAGLDSKRLDCCHDARARDREMVVCNVRNQVKALYSDPDIMSKINKQELLVIGCFYEISSGIVDFFNFLPEAVSNTAVSGLLRAEMSVAAE